MNCGFPTDILLEGKLRWCAIRDTLPISCFKAFMPTGILNTFVPWFRRNKFYIYVFRSTIEYFSSSDSVQFSVRRNCLCSHGTNYNFVRLNLFSVSFFVPLVNFWFCFFIQPKLLTFFQCVPILWHFIEQIK